MYEYKTSGTCAKQIAFEVEDRKVKNVQFTAGCAGNLSGISSLIEGMDIDDVIKRLDGLSCGPRLTSCPDQLAKALKAYKDKHI
ncbi:TIGR03905 family TSCPD domain-containing protein [Vallitalea pronyensis]|uniref:ribonucleoside-diphosphate reductase n=1 Tax=Vallitalea pronyensis TaxID=1348613 RepID=A0A8J8MGQ6_9FIRM|nr:TIGR03905 family TSCPD domain-containing protein [Vallitalea pronyensis]QUI21187.1 TIGR03905 family TSCPD domain-containing protein [Vallitalea pronyensis]